MRVLSIGECMAELAPTGAPGGFVMGFAGDTFNTAWYLAKAAPKARVAYLTGLGDDIISQNLAQFMEDAGVDTSRIVTVPGRTVGLYMISLDNGERSFTYWRGQSAAKELARDKAALSAAMDASDLIYFSGISLAILEPDDRAALLAALRAARAAGKTIVFDPNLRPRLWPSGTAMTDAIMDAAKVSDIALPSFDDEAEWFNDADLKATAKRYADAGATTVVVKNGGGTVHYLSDGTSGDVTLAPVKTVVDSTAAGDSFNAGFLAGLVGGVSIKNSIQNGCQLAAKVVQGKGALVDIDQI